MLCITDLFGKIDYDGIYKKRLSYYAAFVTLFSALLWKYTITNYKHYA